MSFWRAVEAIPEFSAVMADWQKLAGTEFGVLKPFLSATDISADAYPCPNGMCGHFVVWHPNGKGVAVCQCECCDCDPVQVTREDVAIWELNRAKLGRAICQAFGWEVRDFELAPRATWQVGISADGVPVVLTMQRTRPDFLRVVAELVARMGKRFVLLAPTSRLWDVGSMELMERANAVFLGLDTNLVPAGEGCFKQRNAPSVLRDCVSPLPSATVTQPPNAFVFRNVGSAWKVVFDGGDEFHIEDTLGAKYLDYLLRRPNEVISAFDLEVTIRPEKASARSKNSVQTNLDPEAVKQYLRELNKLRAKRDAAAEDGNNAEVDRLDDDIEAIESELQKTGSSGDSGERARGNVSKAVAVVRQKLLKGDKHQKAFGEHIQQFVSTGYECVYSQPSDRIWG